MNKKPLIQLVALTALLSALNYPLSTLGQGSAFNYQGQLNDGGSPANGSYDLRFTIYDAASNGNIPLGGGPLTSLATGVTNGLFTVTLDFGNSPFSAGAARWLNVDVRTNGAGSFATLGPRQPVTAVPYAITAGNVTGNAATATSATTAASATTASTANNFSGALAGDVTGTQAATTVANVGGQTAASVSGGAAAANSASSANTPSTIVKRDASGNFTAGAITAGSLSGNGSGLTGVNAASLNGLNNSGLWQLAGNNVTTGQFLGSTNNQPVELWANGSRALRLEPNANGAPNLIGGASVNFVAPGIVGAVIGGGGATNYSQDGFSTHTNSVGANFGSIGGGIRNTINSGVPFASIGGGYNNSIFGNGAIATIGGGEVNNASGSLSTVAGGYNNRTHSGATYASIGGGNGNVTDGVGATVPGGANNLVTGDYGVIGGGFQNTASGADATIPGGSNNVAQGTFSFAAGQNAQALNTGAFVWADGSIPTPFASTAANQFLIRATNGVAINTNNPGTNALQVIGTVAATRFVGDGSGLTGISSGGGTVTSVTAGAGLAGGTITGSGTISVAPNGVANGMLANSSITVTAGTGLSGGGAVALGSSTTLNNAGVLSVTGNSDITASTVSGAVTLGSTAASANNASTIVKRDASGNFSAGTITATLAGNAATATSATSAATATTATSFSGSLAGDVTGTQGATTVSSVGGQTAANVAGGASAANAAASANTPSAIVKRDASGNFTAGTITATLAGNAATATSATSATTATTANNFSGSLAGDVTGTQSATVVSANIPRLNGTNLFTGTNRFSGVLIATNLTNTIVGTFSGNGAGVTNIGAASILPGSISNPLLASGAVNAGNIAANQVVKSLNGLTDGLTLTGSGGVTITTPNASTIQISGSGGGSGWNTTGNAGTTAGANFVGTTDPQPLELKVNNARALRLELGGPSAHVGNGIPTGAPNVVGGAGVNFVASGTVGAFIGGGGATNYGGSAYTNFVDADFGAIGGGYGNVIQNAAGIASTIGGGQSNLVFVSDHSFIGGGYLNRIQQYNTGATIGGGFGNTIAPNADATIGGGYGNQASGIGSFIGGGGYDGNTFAGNTNGGHAAVIAGGLGNTIQPGANYSAIGGGSGNQASGVGSFIGGGGFDGGTLAGNTNAGNGAVIGGGVGNTIGNGAPHSTIGGGMGNMIQNSGGYSEATISGGLNNIIQAAALHSTIGGGFNNIIQSSSTPSTPGSTIGGGEGNTIQVGARLSTIGGGENNTNTSVYATVPGGDRNVAGYHSLAAGHRAKADNQGSFVWADSTEADFATTGDNQFLIRASGGVGIGTASPTDTLDVNGGIRASGSTTATSGVGVELDYGTILNTGRIFAYDRTGAAYKDFGIGSFGNNKGLLVQAGGNVGIGTASPVHLLQVGNSSPAYCDGGSWVNGSDRNVKSGFEPVDAVAILAKVTAMPITSWHYTNDVTTPHLGPMAQDFYAAFGVGADDKHIATIDEGGVALAAIQGLNQKLEEKDARITELEKRLSALEKLLSREQNQNAGGR